MTNLESINDILPLIKFGVIFTAIVFAIARKWDLALVLGGGALAIGLLFGMKPAALGLSVVNGAIDIGTIKLVGMVYGIITFSVALRETGHLTKFIESIQRLIPSFRITTAAVPALVGLLPMPGGAIFSAPLLDEMTADSGISAERKTFINHWFRHIWEYFLPLYPSIIMAAAIWDVPTRIVVSYDLPLTLFSVVAGFIVVSIGLKAIRRPREPFEREQLLRFAQGVWPFLLIIIAVIAVPIDIIFIVWAMLPILFIADRVSPKRIWEILKSSFRWKILLLIVIVLIFKSVMEDSGAAEEIAQSLIGLELPVILIFFLLPFIIGLLGGIAIASVGIAFPILVPMLGYLDGDIYAAMMLAFAGGFLGVIISPLHLCLILTNEYFGSNLVKTFKYFIPAVAIVALLTWAYYYLLVFL